MDVEVNEEQRKNEEHGNGYADCDGDPSFVGEAMGRSAGGTKIGEVRRGLVREDVGRFYGKW